MSNLFTKLSAARYSLIALLCLVLVNACATQSSKNDADGPMSISDRLARIQETGSSKPADDAKEESASEDSTAAEDASSSTIGADEQSEASAVEQVAEAYVANLDYSLPEAIKRQRAQPKVERDTRKRYDDALKAMEKAKQDNDFDEAIALFEEVEQINPELSGPRTNIAMIYMHQENYEQAEKEFLKALEINEENEFAHFNLALCYKEQGKFQDAKESYQKAIALDPQFAEAHYNLGILAELYLQDIELAIQSFEHYKLALRKKDEQVDIWIQDLRNRLKAEIEYEAKMEAYQKAQSRQENQSQTAEQANPDADQDVVSGTEETSSSETDRTEAETPVPEDESAQNEPVSQNPVEDSSATNNAENANDVASQENTETQETEASE